MRDDNPCGPLQALAGSLLRSQEEERRTLARELHDDICQSLARLEMDVYEFQRSMAADPNVQQRIGEIRASIGGVSAVVRALSHRLYPAIVEDLGLGAALRALTDEFRRREEAPATYFEENVPEDMPPEIATLLYRIAEEALRNAARHAGDAHVEVSFRAVPAGLRLEIADCGPGFDLAEKRSSLGLIGMEERARAAGATFRIESAPGAGARVIVELPLP